LKNTKSAYVKVCPAWIRRGVKATFQSMVQAHVTGAVGGFVGSALSGVTFESWAWSSSDDSGGVGDAGDMSSSSAMDSEIMDSIQDAAAVNDAMVESMTDSAAQSLGTTIHDAIDSVSLEDTMDALSESVGSAVEDAVESIISEDTVDAMVESIVESSMGDALEAIVDDCLAESCVVDEMMESILE